MLRVRDFEPALVPGETGSAFPSRSPGGTLYTEGDDGSRKVFLVLCGVGGHGLVEAGLGGWQNYQHVFLWLAFW